MTLGVLIVAVSYAQQTPPTKSVGVNTPNPKATLHMGDKRASQPYPMQYHCSSSYRRPTKSQRCYLWARPKRCYRICYRKPNGNNSNSKVKNIDKPGYYYFDGTHWMKFKNSEVVETFYTHINDSFLGLPGHRTINMDKHNLIFKTKNLSGNTRSSCICPIQKYILKLMTQTRSGFKLIDGNQGVHRILTSDENGNASWQRVKPYAAIHNIKGIPDIEIKGVKKD